MFCGTKICRQKKKQEENSQIEPDRWKSVRDCEMTKKKTKMRKRVLKNKILRHKEVNKAQRIIISA